MRRSSIRLASVLFLLCAAFASAQVPSGLPSGDAWIAHLTRDLLPFWSMPAAFGTEPGAFPSTRCDDGSALDYAHPCAEVASNAYLMTPARYLVPISRQTYGYGVAYHLTGDPKYLAWMKQGVDYIRRNAFDPAGGMYTKLDLLTNQWDSAREIRDPQQLAYGLLGLSFWYYLTRDESVLPNIVAVRRYIFDHYYNPSLGAMQWLLRDDGGTRATEKRLVADLDQLNAYMVLLTPLLPEQEKADWTAGLRLLSNSMISTYYSPRDNLMFTTANTQRDRDIAYSGADYGHTIKALWMMRWIGLMTGDAGLQAFAEKNGSRVLERAFVPQDGSWGQGALAGGATDRNKNWWIYCELDQFAGSLSLVQPSAAAYLPLTTNYWFRNFVDTRYGEVWNGVDYGTNAPQRDWPKAWPWKSAYHSFEHALVGYITSQFLSGRDATLHFAFANEPAADKIRPYFFEPGVLSITRSSDSSGKYQAVRFGPPVIPAEHEVTVVSGASFLPAPVAPGGIASAFGTNLARSTIAAQETPLPTNLGGTVVTILDSSGWLYDCPLFYVSSGQLNFQIPAAARPGMARVAVIAPGGLPIKGEVMIAPVSPGIFQSNATTGLAAATVQRVLSNGNSFYETMARSDGGDVVPIPIDLGAEGDRVYLALYATGVRGAKNVTALVGGQSVPVLFAGAQPQYIGLDQVNIGPVPRSLAGSGRVNVLVVADGQTAAPVEVVIK